MNTAQLTDRAQAVIAASDEYTAPIFRAPSVGCSEMADPKKCTAKVRCDGGRITTESCTTKQPLIDDGGSSDGERDYYICPDCRKSITVDYREN